MSKTYRNKKKYYFDDDEDFQNVRKNHKQKLNPNKRISGRELLKKVAEIDESEDDSFYYR